MYLIIFNPVSGKGNRNEYQKITQVCESLHFSYDLLITQNETSIHSYFANHQTTNYEAIIIAGGDGTISQTIDSLLNFQMNTPIILYPCGSTNELAQTLSITKNDLKDALERKREARTIDLGLLNEKSSFVYSLTFGNFTHITYRTPQSLKNKLGYAAYWVYSICSLYFTKIRNYSFNITIDDISFEDTYLFGGVSNAFSMGNIIRLDHYAQLEDGLLDIFLIRKPNHFRDYRKIIRALVYRDYSSEWFQLKQGEKIHFKSKHNHSWNKDGEFAGKTDEVKVSIKTNYLTIW